MSQGYYVEGIIKLKMVLPLPDTSYITCHQVLMSKVIYLN